MIGGVFLQFCHPDCQPNPADGLASCLLFSSKVGSLVLSLIFQVILYPPHKAVLLQVGRASSVVNKLNKVNKDPTDRDVLQKFLVSKTEFLETKSVA